ncbi:hypothetical protein RIVM261_034580 [Rivularia sp. IAM M-261]|nr:hypothetical protein RIVM261_034580 [Rivularia sp. IAM M-261]
MAKTTDFTNFTTEHPNYFPGQYLLEDDFEIQHQYLSDRQRYYNQILHVSGIIEGLEVEIIPEKKAVLIKSGSAINSNGQLIILKKDTTFDQFTGVTNGELYIKYSEEKKVKQQEDIADSYTRWIENPILEFANKAPENSVKLARLIIQDTITPDANVREYSGLSLPNSNSKALTLRSGGNVNPNLAVLTGSLKIDGSLTVTGTISGKIDALNITTGQLDPARIPNLSANKITSGTIDGDLIVNGITQFTSDLIVGDLIISGTAEFAGNSIVTGAIKLGYENVISDLGSPLMSGFYTNFGQEERIGELPDPYDWTHLITASNNNYFLNSQLQIAASHQTNDRIFFRKIQAEGASNPTWNELATRGANEFNGSQTISAKLTVNGAIQPSAGNSENNGIMFPKDPGGGSADAAWIRYYSRNPDSTDAVRKEQTTLEIGVSNDASDYITLNPFSNPINFTGRWNGTTDLGNNVAEISNDTNEYKTLMIMGNKSNGQGRRVSVWDRFEVNGTFVNNSSQEHKQDINQLSSKDLNSIIAKLKQTPVFRYRFKTPGIDGKIRLGVIAEQSPEEILDESGKAVSFLDYNGFLLAAIKAQQSLIEQLQNDILLLKKW